MRSRGERKRPGRPRGGAHEEQEKEHVGCTRAGVKSHDVQLTKRDFHVLSTPTSSARGWSRQKVEIELLNVWPVVICDGRVWPGVVCYGWIGM